MFVLLDYRFVGLIGAAPVARTCNQRPRTAPELINEVFAVVEEGDAMPRHRNGEPAR
jgi:hypothetical protein